MTPYARSYRHKNSVVLNPYVVVADVALSLLMVMIAYFVVTSRLTDAVNARKARPILTVADKLLNQAGLNHLEWRNGNEVLYKFRNLDLFDGTSLTLHGRLGMQAIASTMRDRQCSSFVQDVRVTVSEPESYSPELTVMQSKVISNSLYNGRISCPVIGAARLLDQTGSSVSALAETDIVIELK